MLNNLLCVRFIFFFLSWGRQGITGGKTDRGDKQPEMPCAWSTKAGGLRFIYLYVLTAEKSQLFRSCQSSFLVTLYAATLYYIEVHKWPQPLGNKGITGESDATRDCNLWYLWKKCCLLWLTEAKTGLIVVVVVVVVIIIKLNDWWNGFSTNSPVFSLLKQTVLWTKAQW